MSCVNYECLSCNHYSHKRKKDQETGEMVCEKCGYDNLHVDCDEEDNSQFDDIFGEMEDYYAECI